MDLYIGPWGELRKDVANWPVLGFPAELSRLPIHLELSLVPCGNRHRSCSSVALRPQGLWGLLIIIIMGT